MPTKNDEKEISSEISKTVFFTGKQPLMKFEKKIIHYCMQRKMMNMAVWSTVASYQSQCDDQS